MNAPEKRSYQQRVDELINEQGAPELLHAAARHFRKHSSNWPVIYLMHARTLAHAATTIDSMCKLYEGGK